MLFDICGRINDHVNVDSLNLALDSFFSTEMSRLNHSEMNPRVLYEGLHDEKGLWIMLLQNSNGFSYESEILDTKFSFVETIIFEVSKYSEDIGEDYTTAFRFLYLFAKRFSLEMLITLDYEVEICYISGDGHVIWNEEQRERFCLNIEDCGQPVNNKVND